MEASTTGGDKKVAIQAYGYLGQFVLSETYTGNRSFTQEKKNTFKGSILIEIDQLSKMLKNNIEKDNIETISRTKKLKYTNKMLDNKDQNNNKKRNVILKNKDDNERDKEKS